MLAQYMPSSCVGLCVWRSERVSVTIRYCIKMAKCSIMQITPQDTPGTLVSWWQRSWQNSNGITPYRVGISEKSGIFFQNKRTITSRNMWQTMNIHVNLTLYILGRDGIAQPLFRPSTFTAKLESTCRPNRKETLLKETMFGSVNQSVVFGYDMCFIVCALQTIGDHSLPVRVSILHF